MVIKKRKKKSVIGKSSREIYGENGLFDGRDFLGKYSSKKMKSGNPRDDKKYFIFFFQKIITMHFSEFPFSL